jgi:hypothetical protein
MSEVKKVLRRAAKLLEPRGAWTQGEAARNAAGARVEVNAPDAVSFCAFGAICRASPAAGTAGATVALGRALGALEALPGVGCVASWNDKKSRRKGQVIAALRKAASEVA